ncbi:MAG: type II toxin-antitoxin system PemK/MazF family toxin [Kiritimatiellia bacterium]
MQQKISPAQNPPKPPPERRVKRLCAGPGNVLLNKGEANLRKQSVVNVSQVYTADKSRPGEKIGTLKAKRVREIVDGLHVVIEPRDVEQEW